MYKKYLMKFKSEMMEARQHQQSEAPDCLYLNLNSELSQILDIMDQLFQIDIQKHIDEDSSMKEINEVVKRLASICYDMGLKKQVRREGLKYEAALSTLWQVRHMYKIIET